MAKKKRRASSACKATTIKFKTKRGKTIQFKGHAGDGCGPRPKPKTGHLNAYKKSFARQAKACSGKTRGAFLSCMKRAKGALVER